MASKLEIMHVAATLTTAAMAARGGSAAGTIPIDPTNQEGQQRGLNLETWEVFRAFYAAVEGAFADDKNWLPPPASPTAALVVPSSITAILSQPAIAGAIASNPTLAPLVTLLKGLGVAIAPPTPAAPLPNPGAPA